MPAVTGSWWSARRERRTADDDALDVLRGREPMDSREPGPTRGLLAGDAPREVRELDGHGILRDRRAAGPRSVAPTHDVRRQVEDDAHGGDAGRCRAGEEPASRERG